MTKKEMNFRICDIPDILNKRFCKTCKFCFRQVLLNGNKRFAFFVCDKIGKEKKDKINHYKYVCDLFIRKKQIRQYS